MWNGISEPAKTDRNQMMPLEKSSSLYVPLNVKKKRKRHKWTTVSAFVATARPQRLPHHTIACNCILAPQWCQCASIAHNGAPGTLCATIACAELYVDHLVTAFLTHTDSCTMFLGMLYEWGGLEGGLKKHFSFQFEHSSKLVIPPGVFMVYTSKDTQFTEMNAIFKIL